MGNENLTLRADRIRLAIETVGQIVRFLDEQDCTCGDSDDGPYPCWYHLDDADKVYRLGHTLDADAWTQLRDTLLEQLADLHCGHECHVAPGYGFVPEGGCPIHDRSAAEGHSG